MSEFYKGRTVLVGDATGLVGANSSRSSVGKAHARRAGL